MKPNLIIMLTSNDITVSNAAEVFAACKDLPAEHWGFKDMGLLEKEMIALDKAVKDAGKATYLEVAPAQKKTP